MQREVPALARRGRKGRESTDNVESCDPNKGRGESTCAVLAHDPVEGLSRAPLRQGHSRARGESKDLRSNGYGLERVGERSGHGGGMLSVYRAGRWYKRRAVKEVQPAVNGVAAQCSFDGGRRSKGVVRAAGVHEEVVADIHATSLRARHDRNAEERQRDRDNPQNPHSVTTVLPPTFIELGAFCNRQVSLNQMFMEGIQVRLI